MDLSAPFETLSDAFSVLADDGGKTLIFEIEFCYHLDWKTIRASAKERRLLRLGSCRSGSADFVHGHLEERSVGDRLAIQTAQVEFHLIPASQGEVV